MFTGLSAFPLTPLRRDRVDAAAYARVIERLTDAGVDSITALGSTGSYAYLSAEERGQVARIAVRHAAGTPVFVGVGALRTSWVLEHVARAEAAGAAGLLLAPVSYQALTDADVLELFRIVTARTSLPVILYDNPGTTHFTFSTELYGRIAELPGVASIKIPAVPSDPAAARARVDEVRSVIPDTVTVGVSGDAAAATGLTTGCDAWYSVIGGTLPGPALRLTRAAQRGEAAEVKRHAAALQPVWDLFAEFGGSLRVVAAIAETLGLAPHGSLPLPIQGLDAPQRARVAAVLRDLETD